MFSMPLIAEQKENGEVSPTSFLPEVRVLITKQLTIRTLCPCWKESALAYSDGIRREGKWRQFGIFMEWSCAVYCSQWEENILPLDCSQTATLPDPSSWDYSGQASASVASLPSSHEPLLWFWEPKDNVMNAMSCPFTCLLESTSLLSVPMFLQDACYSECYVQW